MMLRMKKDKAIGSSSRFNTHALDEIIVGFGEDGMDSCYIKDFDVFIEKKKEWIDMPTAFKNHDIIIDNYNTMFFEPTNEKDKEI